MLHKNRSTRHAIEYPWIYMDPCETRVKTRTLPVPAVTGTGFCGYGYGYAQLYLGVTRAIH
jgi:hypothetical protein